jgi:hypothetical protein
MSTGITFTRGAVLIVRSWYRHKGFDVRASWSPDLLSNEQAA